MKRKYSIIIIAVILLGILGIFTIILGHRVSTLSDKEAEEGLWNYLVSSNQWEDDYVLEPLNPIVGKIDGAEVYRFEIRYKDAAEQVGSRLIGNYAIAVDGSKIFLYDSANDEWIVQK